MLWFPTTLFLMPIIKNINPTEKERPHFHQLNPIDKIAPAYMAADEVRKIALPTLEGLQFERVQEIISLEANGNYTCLYFRENRKVLVSKTLHQLESLLNNPKQFVRIHRSHIINLNLLKKYVKGKGGYVVMEDGSTYSVASNRRAFFMKAVKRYFG